MIQVLLLGHSWNATDKLLVFRCRCQMQVNRRNAGRTGKWTLCRNFHISADLSSCHALEINRNTCVCAYAFASPPSEKKKHQKGITERPNQKHTENKTGWINRASRTNMLAAHRSLVRSFVRFVSYDQRWRYVGVSCLHGIFSALLFFILHRTVSYLQLHWQWDTFTYIQRRQFGTVDCEKLYSEK